MTAAKKKTLEDSVTSIDQLPGYEIFIGWLGQRFDGVTGGIADLSNRVGRLEHCVLEGNGEPSLKAQIDRNTEYRNACEARADHRWKIRLGFGVSIALFIISAIWNILQVRAMAVLAKAAVVAAGGG